MKQVWIEKKEYTKLCMRGIDNTGERIWSTHLTLDDCRGLILDPIKTLTEEYESRIEHLKDKNK